MAGRKVRQRFYMYWTQTQPGPLFDVDAMKLHSRIDGSTEDDYLVTLVAAATAHAEQVMQSSLMTRTITATFYAGEVLNLPRGPIQSITSVLVSGTPASGGAFSIERYGTADVLRFNNGNVMPYPAPATMTVVYDAGYGSSPADVPADIVQVIKCHAGLLYEQREAATDRTITPVPFIEDFYRLRSREPGIG